MAPMPIDPATATGAAAGFDLDALAARLLGFVSSRRAPQDAGTGGFDLGGAGADSGTDEEAEDE